MLRVHHIAIAGAGLAGLAASIAAANAGVRVDLFEHAGCVAPMPAHIDVVPNLVRDLAALGVAEACLQRCFAYQGMAVVDAEGRTIDTIPTPNLAGARLPAAFGMVYGDLLGVLLAAAEARGVRVHWRAGLRSAQVHGAQVQAVTGDGAEWQGDLLVLAGASNVAGVEQPLQDRFVSLPQCWDFVLLPRPQAIERSTWVIGAAGRKALVVPVDVARVGVACLRDERAHRTADQVTAAALRDRLAGGGPLLAAIGSALPPDAPVIGRPVRFGLLEGPWHAGAALRIGSSAHLLPPHFGQAAAQSMEDAVVLGDLLREGLGRTGLLATFTARRAHRAALVHAITAQAARWDLEPTPTTDLQALARALAPIVAQAA
ncbi:MAG: hypothetical protein IV093_09075 [Rubrivivax sp.]|nr:hypothetical protein [Rubrivivax sp.]